MSSRLSDREASAFLAAIVESSDDAIIGKSLDSTIMTWNSGAERVFGWRGEEIIGRSVRLLIPDDRQDEEDAILASIAAGHPVPTFETVRLRKDGTSVSVAVTVSPVRDADGRIVAASKIARDIGAAKQVRAELESSEQRFRMLADNMSQLAWVADHTGWIYWYNERWFDYTGTTLEDMRGWGWSTVHHPDHIQAVTARWQDSLAAGTAWEDTFPLKGADGAFRWFLSRAIPLRDEDGRIVSWFGTNTDVTEMRDAEKRIELLMMEVNHRSKNMLAIIQALARRTAAQGGDFIGKLEARIQALAANQDVVVQRSWSSVPVRDMIEAQLRVVGDLARQVDRHGPEVRLSPGASETLAMAIHEMATNAITYGALREAEGHIDVVWSLEQTDAGECFTISWEESGGPPTEATGARGFGSRIITDLPRGKLAADVSAEYLPEGFRWSLTCPAANAIPQFGDDSDARSGADMHGAFLLRRGASAG